MIVAVAGLLAIAPPAHAKFVVHVSIDGPGLMQPVELANTWIRIGCTFSRACRPLSEPPGGQLGPRYDVVQTLEGHTARGPMMDRIVHELYPYAPGGPRLFTAAGQTWHDWNQKRRVAGGWTRASTDLMEALTSAGLPEEPPRSSVRSATVRSSAPRDAAARSSARMWVLPVGVALLIAGGVFLPRPRRRGRPPQD